MATIMKCLRYDPKGTTLYYMSYVKTHPQPVPSDLKVGQVIVQVKSASVNPVNFKLTEIPLARVSLPGKTVGLDFAGIIAHVHPSNTKFKTGDNVFGVSLNYGTMSEYIVTTENEIAIMPSNMSFNEAACLPVVYVTALQALRAGNISKDKNVIIVGASGGCGLAGVQITKAILGDTGKITAICSNRNFPLVRQYLRENDETFDYNDTSLADIKKSPLLKMGKFDLMFDTVSSTEKKDSYHDIPYPIAFNDFMKKPKEGGKIISINGTLTNLFWYLIGWQRAGHSIVFFSMKTLANDYRELVTYAEEGKIRVVLDSVYPFTEEAIREAFERSKSRRAVGKIVFDFTLA